MKKSCWLLQVLLLFFCVNAVAQSPRLVTSKQREKIPFVLSPFNNIIIKATLNEQDQLDLMFHTAATDVYIIDSALLRMRTLKFYGKADSVQSWGGNDNSSSYSNENRIAIGRMRWKEIVVWSDKNSGQESDGKFGLNLFRGKVVSIDFDKNELVITDALPRNLDTYQKCELRFENDGMYIKGILKLGADSISNWFLIHSGYSGSLLLDDKFSNTHKLGERLKITGEKKLQDAYGNTIVTRKAILPNFTIGNTALTDAPVGFFEGTLGRQKISVVGGELIKRFNWIISSDRKSVYLRPSRLHNLPFPGN